MVHNHIDDVVYLSAQGKERGKLSSKLLKQLNQQTYDYSPFLGILKGCGCKNFHGLIKDSTFTYFPTGASLASDCTAYIIFIVCS